MGLLEENSNAAGKNNLNLVCEIVAETRVKNNPNLGRWT